MTMGTAKRKGNFGYYNIGGKLLYFNKAPNEGDIQKALEKETKHGESKSRIDCGGACCADQNRTFN